MHNAQFLAHGSRRGFLRDTAVALTAAPAVVATGDRASRPIRRPASRALTILLVGSPGHLDTWDPKPDAPVEFRGPFRPIQTCVPGIEISELFPRIARLADRLALVRSMHHEGPPLHETGQRYAMTGLDFGPASVCPHSSAVVAHLAADRSLTDRATAAAILPLLGDTGAGDLHGQSAGWLGAAYEPRLLDEPCVSDEVHQEPAATRARYGEHPIGVRLLAARRLLERGFGSVTVNHFSTLFAGPTWDMHARGGRGHTTSRDYRDAIAPQFDQAFSALILDLEARGLLDETVVAVVSEMGRTPRLNPRGGRDHYTRAWTNLLAGGPVRGGQVIGATDRTGASITDRPVHPAEFLASFYHAQGIALSPIRTNQWPALRPLAEAAVVDELF